MIEKSKKSNNVVLTIILCFIIIFCGLGLWQPRSIFVVPITTALGIPRSAYSFVETFRCAISAILNVFFGIFVEKFGSKILICVGFTAYTLSAVMFAFAENVVLLYLGGFLLGVGMAWSSTTAIGYIVNRVCGKHKGTVLGFVLAANGVGGAVAAQVFTPFLNDASVYGYRNVFYIMAGIFAFVLILIIIFYKNPVSSLQKQPQK